MFDPAQTERHFVETDFASTFARDPMHAVFWFARYKFVARMLGGKERVVEIGAGNKFAGKIVEDWVGEFVQTDKDLWNPVTGPFSPFNKFDGAFALDVLEHVEKKDEDAFISNIGKTLKPHGTLIIGTPSLESQPYASPASKSEHVNCKTEQELFELLDRHFHCVYMFGMNDEVLHTGFGPMCHYRFGLANTRR